MIEFPREPVFRVRESNDWDGPRPFWQRDWWLRSRELHAKDHGHRYYLPTPRECKGFHGSKDWGDTIVILGCLILFVIAVWLGAF